MNTINSTIDVARRFAHANLGRCWCSRELLVWDSNNLLPEDGLVRMSLPEDGLVRELARILIPIVGIAGFGQSSISMARSLVEHEALVHASHLP